MSDIRVVVGTPHDEFEVTQEFCYKRSDAKRDAVTPAVKITGWHVWGQNRNGSSLVVADLVALRALRKALKQAEKELEARCLAAAREGAQSG